MNAKTVLLITAILTLLVEHHVHAEFFYNRVLPKDEELSTLDLKCVPGRTIIRVEEKIVDVDKDGSSEEDDDDVVRDFRRKHMTVQTNDEYCKVCVCSVSGKDEYCSRRPARNVNECLRMATLMETFKQNLPFDHERSLSYRIRRVGSDVKGANETHCIPFVSEYSDCSDANICLGCLKCTCTAEGKWSCKEETNCPGLVEADPTEEDNLIDNAIQAIENELETKERHKKVAKVSNNHPYVPGPTKYNDDILLEAKRKMDDDIRTIMTRVKRSISKPKAAKKNSTLKFYGAVDEINEDTLKNSNNSGTINIKKVEVAYKPQNSRRVAVTDNNSSLKIDYEHELYDTHITHNKLETNHSETGNTSVKIKDKDLSNIVVNELKSGTEHIGDKHAPVMSNITFKSENDTLTAMTFIAGNLLNKLWNMEKDSNGESLETEILKHEKIDDLLELFREPLSMRQETFLKNALEHLSNAINSNKNANNMTLCASIDEASRLLTHKDSTDEVKSLEKGILSHEKENFKPATTEAVSKINNVLNLMRKFEELQNLGNSKLKNKTDIRENDQIDYLTRDEYSALSIYGNILEKITKLIMPNKNSKRFLNKIRNLPSQDVSKKLKDSFNIDVGENKMTAKDKLILEYITHMENNPGCLLKNNRNKLNVQSIPKVEGILQSLSDLFKIKYFIDLLKILEPAKSNLRVSVDTTDSPIMKTTTESVTVATTLGKKQNKLALTKEKLKAHLKTIVEDLIEMQNVAGSLSNESEQRLANAFPCIYNILNGVDLNEKDNLTEIEKVKSIFESIKAEMNSPQTRRSNVVTEGRPKSVVVWERVVKNLDKKQKQTTRRSFNAKLPKSFDDLKKMIDSIESYGSNTYKNIASFTEVPPAEKLVLLKTLDADTKRYINILDYIRISINTGLSLQKLKDLEEFVENADRNIKLNEKVVKTLNKKINLGVDGKKQLALKLKTKASYKVPEAFPILNTFDTNNKIKVVSRDEIIHQLIKNRMQIYIRMKEAKGDVINDVNYDIAKKILTYLENGNYEIARELYKFYVSRKQMSDLNNPNDIFQAPVNENLRGPSVLNQKQPLIQFEDPYIANAKMQPMTQEHLLKQLQNIKNMRI